MSENKTQAEMVTIVVDDKEIKVPKGTNLVDAALGAGVEIPHYCYHPHLSIAGNCRMCQVEIVGQPKLAIACNTTATEGLKVRTHYTSAAVEESQRATLEFLLINHPLDCTVCDQAGHCKLQDYYYEYNGKGSRFIENKVHKVKAEPLGPEVIYDGERCIMCTRCVRFCDEVTKTSELGAFNRGDKGEIGVAEGKELTNALSGSVVDLCPVGALTHRRWRFNTRMWYADAIDTICTGCSTGCNSKVAVRDDRIVQVKARLNSAVNQEWMCDEGRYGFERFQPATRLNAPQLRTGDSFQEISWAQAQTEAAKLKGQVANDAAVFLSPFLTLEEVWIGLQFAEKIMGVPLSSGHVAMQLRKRTLTPDQAVLVSPDYAPNARALSVFGTAADNTWREATERAYDELLKQLRSGSMKRVLLIGDQAILDSDVDAGVISALNGATSVAITPRAVGGDKHGGAHENSRLLFAGRTVNEKAGLMVNKDGRIQQLRQLLSGPFGSIADWLTLNRLATSMGKALVPVEVVDERSLFREMVKQVPKFSGLTLMKIGTLGLSLNDLGAKAAESEPARTAP